jgi:hypothetical protein
MTSYVIDLLPMFPAVLLNVTVTGTAPLAAKVQFSHALAKEDGLQVPPGMDQL